MKIHKGDMVIVTIGDKKGVVVAAGDKRPTPSRVLQVVDGGAKVVVQGVNRVFKHVKKGHPKSPQGGRLSLELPIDTSNVMFYCSNCGRGVRLGYRYTEDGRKERFCKSCKVSVSVLSPARKAYAKKS